MSSFTTEAFSLLAVGICVIGVRTAARISLVGIRGFKADDYLMLVAAVIYSLETATAYIVGAWWFGLANNGMTDEERKALDPNSHEAYLRRGGSKTQLVGWSLYTLLLWTLKLCLTIFYSRLISGIQYLERRVKIAYVMLGVTYVATELSILLGCHPFAKNWQIYPNPGNHCQPSISKIDCYVTVILNVLTDVYLLSIPIPMLWRANLSKPRKASLLVIFCGGILVMACGILRCAIIIRSPVTGAQAAGSWACRETFVAVVIGNIPLIYPAASRQLRKLANSPFLSKYNLPGLSSNKNSGATPPKYELNPTIGSERMRVKGGKKNIRSVNALPSTFMDTFGTQQDAGSEERIVGWKGTVVAQTVMEEEPTEGDGESRKTSGSGDGHSQGGLGGITVTKDVSQYDEGREPGKIV